MNARFPSGLWAVVLIASVLVNGVILGVIGAGAAAGLRFSAGEQPDAPPPVSMRMLAEGLPPEAQDALRQRLRDQALRSRPLIVEAAEADEAAMDALAADPFDAAAAQAAFERVRQTRAALERQAHEMAITLFADLPAERRAQIVAFNERRRQWDRFGGPDGPDFDRDGPRGWGRDGPWDRGPDFDRDGPGFGPPPAPDSQRESQPGSD